MRFRRIHICTIENRKALTQANVPFLLCPLLESSNRDLQEAAAKALAEFVHADKHEEMAIAEQAKEALASSNCIPTLRPLLQVRDFSKTLCTYVD